MTRVVLRTPRPLGHRAAVADAEYVLCDHGYLRLGWCDECRTRGTQTDVLDLSVLPYLAIVLVVGFMLVYLYMLDQAILVHLAAFLYLAIVAILGWIVFGREVRASTSRKANEAAPRSSRPRT